MSARESWRRRHEPKAPNGRYLQDVIDEIVSNPYVGVFYCNARSEAEYEAMRPAIVQRQLDAVVAECPAAAPLVARYRFGLLSPVRE